MRLDSRDFSDTVQMESAIRDIRRYQAAYVKANGVSGILVKWMKGWFAVKSNLGYSFYRPTTFRNMTDVLEKRANDKCSSP